MLLRAYFGLKFGNIRWAAALALTFVLGAGARNGLYAASRGGNFVHETGSIQDSPGTPAVPEPARTSSHKEITQYVMDFDGDHSIDLATVIEQQIGGDVHYTVQLYLASGAEQSVDVAAPAGGLQIEMHDLTGDKIPNDLVLRPALLRWLPTMLLNDGHDHFAVIISGTSPSSISNGQELASRPNDARGTIALLSAGFKAGRTVQGRGFLDPFVQANYLVPARQPSAKNPCDSPSFGRPPPALVITPESSQFI